LQPIPNHKIVIEVPYSIGWGIYDRMHNEANRVLRAGEVGYWKIKVQFPNGGYLGVEVIIEPNGEAKVIFETPYVRETFNRGVSEVSRLNLPSNIKTVTVISNPCNTCGDCGKGIKTSINNPNYKDGYEQKRQELEAKLKKAEADLAGARRELEDVQMDLNKLQQEKQELEELKQKAGEVRDRAREFVRSVDSLKVPEFEPVHPAKTKVEQPKVEQPKVEQPKVEQPQIVREEGGTITRGEGFVEGVFALPTEGSEGKLRVTDSKVPATINKNGELEVRLPELRLGDNGDKRKY
jgi:hypothetical protein